jgi:hypothetical protein
MYGDLENDVELIIEVRNKIRRELAKLNEKVFEKKQYFKGAKFYKVEVQASDEVLELIKIRDNKDPVEEEVIDESLKKKMTSRL